MISTSSTSGADNQSSVLPLNPKGTLGKDAFLKLLAVQLQNQDPSKPMDNQDFMGQMAQFGALEQTTNMAAGLSDESLSHAHTLSQAQALGSGASDLLADVIHVSSIIFRCRSAKSYADFVLKPA